MAKEYKYRSINRSDVATTVTWQLYETTVTQGVDEFGNPIDIVDRVAIGGERVSVFDGVLTDDQIAAGVAMEADNYGQLIN